MSLEQSHSLKHVRDSTLSALEVRQKAIMEEICYSILISLGT